MWWQIEMIFSAFDLFMPSTLTRVSHQLTEGVRAKEKYCGWW